MSCPRIPIQSQPAPITFMPITKMILQELLSNTNLKIDDIANQCGFKYGSYFNRQFTKCLGISPSEFRKNPTGYSMFEGDKVMKL
ncbi:MAG: helix-turn-helix domain-containing protein [Lachnospiraceae bacterium]